MNSFLRRPSSMKSFKAPGWWNVCYFLTYVTAEFHGKASPSSPAARREEPGHSYPLGRFVRPDLQEICIIPLTVIGWISAWLYPTRKQREEEVDRGSGGQLIICAMHFKHKSIPGYVLWDHVPSWGTLTAFGHQRKRTTHAPAFRNEGRKRWNLKIAVTFTYQEGQHHSVFEGFFLFVYCLRKHLKVTFDMPDLGLVRNLVVGTRRDPVL